MIVTPLGTTHERQVLQALTGALNLPACTARYVKATDKRISDLEARLDTQITAEQDYENQTNEELKRVCIMYLFLAHLDGLSMPIDMHLY